MTSITSGNPGWFQPSLVEMLLEKVELLYPPILLLVFIISSGIHGVLTSRSEEELDAPLVLGPGGKPLPVTKRKKEKPAEPLSDKFFSRAVKSVLFYLTFAVVVTFSADILSTTLHVVESRRLGHQWWCGEARIVYIVGSAFLYLYVFITLLDWRDSPNAVHFVVWFLGMVGEFAILVLLACARTSWQHNLQVTQHAGINGTSKWNSIDIAIAVIRLVLFVGLVAIYAPVAAKRYLKEKRLREEEATHAQRLAAYEATPLLQRDLNNIDYRTRDSDAHSTSSSETDCHTNGTEDYRSRSKDDEEMGFYRPEKLPHKTWYEYCRGYKLFFQYLWPTKSPRLQGLVFVCFILVLCQRIVNVMVPYQLGVLTDSLRLEEGIHKMPWSQLLVLIMLKLFQGTGGLLGCLRDILWIGVSQHTYRALTTAAFEHVHSLSLEFHLSKKTGEVLSALNKGASINSFLEQITFQVGPMLLDLMLAIFFFYAQFGPIYALIVSVVSFYYLYLTVRMAATRADQRRDMVNADREEEAIKNDSITSYETVKYFNAEPFEFRRYRGAIAKFQKAEAQVTWGLTAMNLAQSFIFVFGILAAMTVCAFEVSEGSRTVGDFVSLVTYLAQLQGPLTYLGVFYRTVQQAMIAGERLLELFKIRPTVVDKPGVMPLNKCQGYIQWNNVDFSYDDRRPALRNLSFECKPGTTTAFVGESGGGKSTVFRLMYRYYNSSAGSIEIDGHDVKHLTIDSVRRYIGVVPQDTILFNESLMYNLRYANAKATDQEVYDACRLAAIHDRIMSFPDGYNTNVGDRGVRLSGGEKQRVAIARALLKNPKIIMLDEATSALDGETEQRIQAKLISGNLGAGRTLLIIAHRLSTITHADQIVVLHAGAIAEKGTHEELLARGGRYAAMWEKHCRAELAAEEARVATGKAQELLRQAKLLPKACYHKPDPSSPSDTEEVPALS